MRINVVGSENAEQIIVLKKTNVTLSISLNQKVTTEWIMRELSSLGPYLTTHCGLYPCPKTYALVHVLKNRKLAPTANAILEKYWFPSWRLVSLEGNTLTATVSLPPLSRPKEEELLTALGTRLKATRPQIVSLQRGCMSYVDLPLVNIMHMSCLSYTNKPLEMVVSDFWTAGEFEEWMSADRLLPNEQYNLIENTVLLPKDKVGRLMTHLLALY